MAKRIIIPARYGSTRLPGKALLEIDNKPIVQLVYEKAAQCGFDSVLIATDDLRIQQVAQSFGADVCMTSIDHPTGTDRLAEAVKIKDYDSDDIIVNIQGDEPFVPVANVLQVAQNLEKYQDAAIATLCVKIDDEREAFDPSCVKVVMDKQGYGLYFSRASIPWAREDFPNKQLPKTMDLFRHLGMYGYRASFLQDYTSLSISPLEKWESLEQLRALWHGYKIHVDIAREPNPPGIDTMEDLIRARKV